MRTKELHQLIADAQAGQQTAIESLLMQCQADLHLLAHGACETPEDIHDAVQETLIIISNKVATLKIVSAFWGWTKRVILHECLRLKDKSKRWAIGEMPFVPDTGSDRDDNELRYDLSKCIEQLPPEQRWAIQYCDVIGLSAQEASLQLNISKEATKSRLRRARAELKIRMT